MDSTISMTVDEAHRRIADHNAQLTSDLQRLHEQLVLERELTDAHHQVALCERQRAMMALRHAGKLREERDSLARDRRALATQIDDLRDDRITTLDLSGAAGEPASVAG